MKCETVREKLTAYLDGDLEDERGGAVRGHLRSCEACQAIAHDEAALRDGLRSLPTLDPPPSLWEGVQKRLAAEEARDAEHPAWRRAFAWLRPRAAQLGLAGAALTAAVTLLVVRMQRDDAPVVSQLPPGPAQVAVVPPSPAPEQHGTCNLTPADGDVTAALAAEPARITECYAQTTRELLELANDARGQWTDERKHEFEAELTKLQQKVALATDERPRRDAYRKLIRYLQRAVIQEDVALANIGGAQ
jgi:hypothetical protein